MDLRRRLQAGKRDPAGLSSRRAGAHDPPGRDRDPAGGRAAHLPPRVAAGPGDARPATRRRAGVAAGRGAFSRRSPVSCTPLRSGIGDPRRAALAAGFVISARFGSRVTSAGSRCGALCFPMHG
jgi:hypothetical protein